MLREPRKIDLTPADETKKREKYRESSMMDPRHRLTRDLLSSSFLPFARIISFVPSNERFTLLEGGNGGRGGRILAKLANSNEG